MRRCAADGNQLVSGNNATSAPMTTRRSTAPISGPREPSQKPIQLHDQPLGSYSRIEHHTGRREPAAHFDMPDSSERWRPSWDDILEAVKSGGHHRDPSWSLTACLTYCLPYPAEPSSPSALPGWYKDDQNVTDFGPTPLHDDVRVLACPDCKRPVLQEAFGFHQSRSILRGCRRATRTTLIHVTCTVENCQLIRDIRSGKVELSVLDPPARSRKRSNAGKTRAANRRRE